MTFDPQIVAHEMLFVNALRSGQMAHVPAMPFAMRQQFITTVNAALEKNA